MYVGREKERERERERVAAIVFETTRHKNTLNKFPLSALFTATEWIDKADERADGEKIAADDYLSRD